MEKLRSQESVASGQEKLSGQLPVFSGQALYNEDYFKTFSAFDHENIHGPNTGSNFGGVSSASGFGRIQSTSMIDTYYIYSFDGKLMAEYDHDGNCVKDYIYAGNRLIAEYRPNDHIPGQDEEYYYYMSDQINSTRIVTDDSGNVVYSAAHRPFGKFKDVWTKTYDPKLKFSGKEREAYGDLDYFGARYYDHNSYRFISVDPVINKKGALANPQLWNLYSYCRNNPITFLDPDGRLFVEFSKDITQKERQTFWKGLSKLYKAVQNNPKAKAYFKKFNIDIEETLRPGSSGPTIHINRKDFVTFFHGDKYDGSYSPNIINYLRIDDRTLKNEQAVASTLIHELAHWANDVSDFWGDLDPDLTGVPAFKNPDPIDGPYGYAAEIVTFGFIYPFGVKK